jgi:hypothetical protein
MTMPGLRAAADTDRRRGRRWRHAAIALGCLAATVSVDGASGQVSPSDIDRVDAALAAIEADIRAAGVAPEFRGTAPDIQVPDRSLCRRKLEEIVKIRRQLDQELPDIRDVIDQALTLKNDYRQLRRASDVECADDAMAVIARVEALLKLPALTAGVDEVDELRTCIFDGKDRIDARRSEIEREETEPGLRSVKLRRLARVEESYDDEETKVDATGQAYGKAADLATRLRTEMSKERQSCESIEDF